MLHGQTTGHLVVVGLGTNKPVIIGITPSRLLLIFTQTDEILTLWRDRLRGMEWKWVSGTLQLILSDGVINIKIRGREARKLARAVYNEHLDLPKAGFQAEAKIVRDQVHAYTLEKLGFVGSALSLLEWIGANVGIEYVDDEQLDRLDAYQFALRTTAVLLFIVAVTNVISLTIVGGGALAVSTIIDLMIGYNLWRGRTIPWVAFNLFRWIAGTIVFGVFAITTLDFITITAQVLITLAMFVALTGSHSRVRTFFAIALFAAGLIIPMGMSSFWDILQTILTG